MKLPFLIILSAAIVPGILAMECKKGIRYCGRSLLKNDEIDQLFGALDKAGVKDPTEHIILESLFECLPTRNGQVNYITTCNQPCQEGPRGANDFCT